MVEDCPADDCRGEVTLHGGEDQVRCTKGHQIAVEWSHSWESARPFPRMKIMAQLTDQGQAPDEETSTPDG